MNKVKIEYSVNDDRQNLQTGNWEIEHAATVQEFDGTTLVSRVVGYGPTKDIAVQNLVRTLWHKAYHSTDSVATKK